MDDYYFKARLRWKRGIESLSDAEAGRLMRAVWDFAQTGVAAQLSGRENGIYQMIIGDMLDDAEQRNSISEVRRNAANNRWNKQNNANNANAQLAMQSYANDGNNSNNNNNNNSNNNSKSKNARGRVLNAQKFTQREYHDDDGMDAMMEGQA